MSTDMFAGLDVDETLEVEEQRIAGPSKFIKETGVFTSAVKMARMIVSKGGASGLVMDYETEDGRGISKTIYYTNKSGETFYVGKKDGKRHNLPGYNEVKRLTQLLLGKEASVVEEKVVEVWDYASKSMVDTPSKVITNFLGKPLKILVRETLEDKTELNAASGKYEPNGETRKVFEIEGYVDAVSDQTAAEKELGADPKSFKAFEKSILDMPVNDKRKVASGDVSAPKPQAEPSTEAKSVFG